jgi:hypothetical protein
MTKKKAVLMALGDDPEVDAQYMQSCLLRQVLDYCLENGDAKIQFVALCLERLVVAQVH